MVATLLVALVLGACSDSGPTGPTADDVVAIEIQGGADALRVGQSRSFTAVVFLGGGETTEELEVTWSSGTPGTLQVSGDGNATALAAGAGVVRAEVGEVSAELSLTVLSEDAPEVDGVVPEAFVDGETAVISGRNFGTSPGDNQVRLDGLPLEVLEASDTELTVRVPQGICLPTGPVDATLTVAGETVSLVHLFEGLSPEEPASGELQVERGGDTLCVRVPASASSSAFIMGVQSTSLVPDEVASARFQIGVPSGTGASHAGPTGSEALQAAPGRTGPRGEASGGPGSGVPHGAIGAGPQGLRTVASSPDPHEIHHRFMEAQAPLVNELLARRGARGPQVMADMPARSEVPGGTEVGDTVTVRFPEVSDDFTVTCSEFQDIHAVMRVRTDHFFVLEDTENPSGGYTEDDFQAAADFLESTTRPRLEEHFGEFTDVDGNGRVVLVFSQEVNRLGPLGFVNPLDFFGTGECAASNGGEFLFNQVPDPQGSVGRQVSRDEALKGLNSLNAHELTHVIQSGRRISQNRPTMGIWQAEGQAMIGEEIIGWEDLGLGAGQNLPAEVAFVGASPDDPDTDWFFNRFVDLAFWYGFSGSAEAPQVEGAPEACGWLSREASGPCDYPRLPYGVSWSFLRWLTDQYGVELAGGREGLHRDWIESDQASMQDLAALVGEDRRDLLASWAATLWTDGRPGMDDRLLFPSWDLGSVESALVDPATLQPDRRSFEASSRELSVASGSTSYTLVSGGSRPETVFRVRGAGGGPAPSSLQLWIVKVP